MLKISSNHEKRWSTVEIKRMYMTVSVDEVPGGLNLFFSISPDVNPTWDNRMYPHTYSHVGVPCTWLVKCNQPLSSATLLMLTEYADKSCAEATAHNHRRQVVNRK